MLPEPGRNQAFRPETGFPYARILAQVAAHSFPETIPRQGRLTGGLAGSKLPTEILTLATERLTQNTRSDRIAELYPEGSRQID